MPPRVSPAARRDRFTLPSGRRLAWSEWGATDGRPVLFCTGAGMSGALGVESDVAEGLGVRLIGIDRPGLGGSDPDPDKAFETWVADVATLIRSLGLERPRALGVSQGAPFALALGAAEIVAAVSVVTGQDELAHPEVRPMLAPEVAILVASAELDPAGFESHIAATAGADWLWTMIEAMSAPEDVAFYQSEPFRTLYRTALDEGFSQGAGGYARDLSLTFRPWPFLLETMSVPVDLWFALGDRSPVHSPDHGTTLARRLPKSRLEVDDTYGGALLWQRSRDILESLLAR